VYPGLLGMDRIYKCFATSWTQTAGTPPLECCTYAGIRRTSAMTCELHFYIKLLKMVSNTRYDIILYSGASCQKC
jgi:hypothetical protein